MVDTLALNSKLNKWAGAEGVDYLCEESGLSACFKWLVPKLRKIMGFLDFEEFMKLWVNTFTWKKEFFKAKEEAALALCQAIEKLIDDS